ncbi:hypothetical protein [Lysobacter antibioticus]|uniref:hypothetical protein n=1 Tax=Lysobacter antibioticus TaxID=84531 RepID=UPI0011875AAD|nr:hypothetical protein [Lysobacter antibioticus]
MRGRFFHLHVLLHSVAMAAARSSEDATTPAAKAAGDRNKGKQRGQGRAGAPVNTTAAMAAAGTEPPADRLAVAATTPWKGWIALIGWLHGLPEGALTVVLGRSPGQWARSFIAGDKRHARPQARPGGGGYRQGPDMINSHKLLN